MNDNQSLDPNHFIHSLDMFAGWTLSLIHNNGDDEIDDEGAPIHANYSPATLTSIALALAYSRLVRVVAACIFKLHQGDLSEEQFHHEMDEALEMLDKECE